MIFPILLVTVAWFILKRLAFFLSYPLKVGVGHFSDPFPTENENEKISNCFSYGKDSLE